LWGQRALLSRRIRLISSLVLDKPTAFHGKVAFGALKALMVIGMCGFIVAKLWPSWPETTWQYISVVGLIIIALMFGVATIRDAVRRDRQLNQN
jgi:hypothetical protein